MIHAQGWEIVGNPNGDLIFLDKWGLMYQPVRPRFPSGYVGNLLDWIGDYGQGRLRRMALANGPP